MLCDEALFASREARSSKGNRLGGKKASWSLHQRVQGSREGRKRPGPQATELRLGYNGDVEQRSHTSGGWKIHMTFLQSILQVLQKCRSRSPQICLTRLNLSARNTVPDTERSDIHTNQVNQFARGSAPDFLLSLLRKSIFAGGEGCVRTAGRHALLSRERSVPTGFGGGGRIQGGAITTWAPFDLRDLATQVVTGWCK